MSCIDKDHLPRLGKPLGVYYVYDSLNYFNDKEKIDSDINSYSTPLAIDLLFGNQYLNEN